MNNTEIQMANNSEIHIPSRSPANFDGSVNGI